MSLPFASIFGLIDFFQLAACGVFDDLRPGLVGFAERDGVGMTRAAVLAESFVGTFGHMRAAHDDLESRLREERRRRDRPRATIRVIAPMPTRPIFSSLQNCTSSGRVIAFALPSMRITSCSFGVSDWRRNIQRCGIKLRVTPLSGL